MSELQKTYPCLVYVENNEILGYAYASPYCERIAYIYSTDLSIYLHPYAKGKGIGTKLYLALMDILQKQGFYNVYACITGQNHNSIAFHSKLGFKKIATFENSGYKFGEWLDII